MQVEYCFIADAAQVSSDGKLSALGIGISQIWATAFPTTRPHMAFVLMLKVHPTECDTQHSLRIELWDPDGKALGQVDGQFAAQRREGDPPRPLFVPLVIDLLGQQFPRPGDYAFHVVVDGHHLKEVPFHLAQTANPPQNQPRLA